MENVDFLPPTALSLVFARETYALYTTNTGLKKDYCILFDFYSQTTVSLQCVSRTN